MMSAPLNKLVGIEVSAANFFDKNTPTDHSQPNKNPAYSNINIGNTFSKRSIPLEKSSAEKTKTPEKNSIPKGIPIIKMKSCQCFICRKNFMYF